LNKLLDDILNEPALALPLLGFCVFIFAVIFWGISSYLAMRKQSKVTLALQKSIISRGENFKIQIETIKKNIETEPEKPQPRQMKDHRIDQILDMLDQQALSLTSLKNEYLKVSPTNETKSGLDSAIELARSGSTAEVIHQKTGLSIEQAEAIVRFHGSARD